VTVRTPNKQQTGHAIEGFSGFDRRSRLSRLLSQSFGKGCLPGGVPVWYLIGVFVEGFRWTRR
jgi:hypothetical protein